MAEGVSILGYSTLNASPELKNEAYQALLEGAASGAIKVSSEAFPLAEAPRAWQALVAAGEQDRGRD